VVLWWWVALAAAGGVDYALATLAAAGPADVAVGVVRWHRTDAGYGGDAGPSRPFEIGSTSKTFTGLLLADAVVRGEVVLGEPMRLPPGIRFPDGPPPTWRELATHTSGLPRGPANQADAARSANDPYPVSALWAAVTTTRRGTRSYDYSNFGIGLLGESLGLLVAPYPERLQRRVLQPLGLGHTGFLEVPPGRSERGTTVAPWHFDGLRGAGSLDSTLPDQLRWLAAWLDPDATPIPEALRLASDVHHRRDSDQAMGLGWRIREEDGLRILQHTGTTRGFSTYVGLEVTHGVGVVVMRARKDTDLVAEVGKGLLARMVRGPEGHVDPALLRAVVRRTDERMITHHGKVVTAPDLTRMPVHTSERTRGLWTALAALRAMQRRQLDAGRVVQGATVAEHVRRVWSDGAPADDPLRAVVREVTGRPVEAYARQELLAEEVPEAVGAGLRLRDLARVGELLSEPSPTGVPLLASEPTLPAHASGASWHDPVSGLTLWQAPGRVVAVTRGPPDARVGALLRRLDPPTPVGAEGVR